MLTVPLPSRAVPGKPPSIRARSLSLCEAEFWVVENEFVAMKSPIPCPGGMPLIPRVRAPRQGIWIAKRSKHGYSNHNHGSARKW